MPPKKISLSRTTFKLTLMNPGYQHKQSRKWEVIWCTGTMHQNSDHDSHKWVLISAQPQVSSIFHTYFSLFSTIVAATSVDAEWAFSTGRHQINFTQHNINSQTFREEMTLQSWIKSPLYPGFDKFTQIIEKKMDDDFFSSWIPFFNTWCHQNCLAIEMVILFSNKMYLYSIKMIYE